MAIKIPKKYSTLEQQEAYLAEKFKKNNLENDELRMMLGRVRGGYKFEPTEEAATLDYELPDKNK